MEIALPKIFWKTTEQQLLILKDNYYTNKQSNFWQSIPLVGMDYYCCVGTYVQYLLLCLSGQELETKYLFKIGWLNKEWLSIVLNYYIVIKK